MKPCETNTWLFRRGLCRLFQSHHCFHATYRRAEDVFKQWQSPPGNWYFRHSLEKWSIADKKIYKGRYGWSFTTSLSWNPGDWLTLIPKEVVWVEKTFPPSLHFPTHFFKIWHLVRFYLSLLISPRFEGDWQVSGIKLPARALGEGHHF